MSSIADKFKRLLPARDTAVAIGGDTTIAMDPIESQPGFDQKTVLMRRDAQVAAANEPVQGAAAGVSAEGEPLPVAEAPPASPRSDLQRQQRYLFIALALVVLVLLVIAGSAIVRADRIAQQVAATGQSLMQSQRLAKSVSQALVGDVKAFAEVKDSSGDLSVRAHGLASGDESLDLEPVSKDMEAEMGKILPLVDRASASAKAVLAQQQILTQVGAALRNINRQSSDLLEMTETVASLKMQQSATVPEISAAGQLVMLTQRIGKSANEFLTVEGVSPDAVFLLG